MKQFALLRGGGSSSSISLPIRQHAQRRLLSSRASKARDEPDSQSPEGPRQDGDLLKVDAETKTINTAAGPLPISPLMDPSYQEATQRFKKPKAKENNRRKTKFQRQLARNPYAQALATPIRQCPATRVTIPRFFLQDFKLFEHPETKEPWWVPAGLAPSHPSTETQARDGAAGKASKPAKPEGSAGYVLARQALLRGFSAKGGGHYRGYKQLQRMFRTSQMQGLASRAVWREDMDGLVLDLMRKRIVESLLLVGGVSAEQGRKYVQRLSGWEELKDHKHRGCVLVLDEAASGPGQFATVDVEGATRNGKLPVYNLVTLLGRDYAERLRRESAAFRAGSLFLVGRQRTVDLQLRLWKLQGYIESFAAQSWPQHVEAAATHGDAKEQEEVAGDGNLAPSSNTAAC